MIKARLLSFAANSVYVDFVLGDCPRWSVNWRRLVSKINKHTYFDAYYIIGFKRIEFLEYLTIVESSKSISMLDINAWKDSNGIVNKSNSIILYPFYYIPYYFKNTIIIQIILMISCHHHYTSFFKFLRHRFSFYIFVDRSTSFKLLYFIAKRF